MDKARLTLVLILCGVFSGCSTESTPQRRGDSSPVFAGDGEGDSGTENGDDMGNIDEPDGPGNAGADEDDAGVAMACEPGPTKGSSVLLIGDSYLDYNNKAFGTELQRLAKADGALAANDKYTDRSVSGTQLSGGFIGTPIPDQYKAENNSDGHVKTVVMDGGGNDVLVGNRSCVTTQAPPESKSCVDTINKAVAAAKKLLAQMADDGVEDVVYFFYPRLPGGGLGGNKELENRTLEYAIPVVKQTCEQAPLRCVFVDTRGLFGEQPSDFQDGIHPIVENTKKISAKVWSTMKQECIAQ